MRLRKRRAARVLAGFIGVIFLALASACLVTGCDSAVQVDLGPRATVSFSAAWREIAAAGEFEPDAARVNDLRLDFTPAGVLSFFRLWAGADDGRSVSFGWQPTHPDDPDIRVRAVVRDDEGQRPPWSGPSVADVFAALDGAGVGRMVAMMPSDAIGLYRFELMNAPGGGTFGGATLVHSPAFLWQDGAFRPLPEEDDWRAVSAAAAYFFVSGAVPVSSSPATSIGGDGTSTVTSQYQGSAYAVFVIPLPAR